MSWINGFTTVAITGTWLEFFLKFKETIAERTDFQIINGDDDYSFTIDFGNGFTSVITDSVITSSSITSNSNSIKIVTSQKGVQRSSISRVYSSASIAQNTSHTRTLSIFTYHDNDISIFAIGTYADTESISILSQSFMSFNTKNIANNNVESKFKAFGNTLYNSGGESSSLSQIITAQSSGIIRINMLIVSSSKIVEYCPDIYNCSTVTPYRNYLINGQQYYAIDSNMLVKV